MPHRPASFVGGPRSWLRAFSDAWHWVLRWLLTTVWASLGQQLTLVPEIGAPSAAPRLFIIGTPLSPVSDPFQDVWTHLLLAACMHTSDHASVVSTSSVKAAAAELGWWRGWLLHRLAAVLEVHCLAGTSTPCSTTDGPCRRVSRTVSELATLLGRGGAGSVAVHVALLEPCSACAQRGPVPTATATVLAIAREAKVAAAAEAERRKPVGLAGAWLGVDVVPTMVCATSGGAVGLCLDTVRLSGSVEAQQGVSTARTRLSALLDTGGSHIQSKLCALSPLALEIHAMSVLATHNEMHPVGMTQRRAIQRILANRLEYVSGRARAPAALLTEAHACRAPGLPAMTCDFWKRCAALWPKPDGLGCYRSMYSQPVLSCRGGCVSPAPCAAMSPSLVPARVQTVYRLLGAAALQLAVPVCLIGTLVAIPSAVIAKWSSILLLRRAGYARSAQC